MCIRPPLYKLSIIDSVQLSSKMARVSRNAEWVSFYKGSLNVIDTKKIDLTRSGCPVKEMK